MSMEIKRKCKNCGKIFSIYSSDLKWRAAKYCSMPCYRKGSYRKVKKQCLFCNKTFMVFPSKADKSKYCSRKCSDLGHRGRKSSLEARRKIAESIMGEKHPLWKGGKYFDKGYLYLYAPNHSYAKSGRYVRRSRLVMEKTLGRYLLPTEVVHHINGIKNDDRIENLMLFQNNRDHMIFERKTKRKLINVRT